MSLAHASVGPNAVSKPKANLLVACPGKLSKKGAVGTASGLAGGRGPPTVDWLEAGRELASKQTSIVCWAVSFETQTPLDGHRLFLALLGSDCTLVTHQTVGVPG